MNKKERYQANAGEIWKNILSKEIPVPEGYTDFLINEVFTHARYLFMYRKKKIKYGYCTHCNTESEIDLSLKHNDKSICPHCGSKATCKDAGRKRGKLYHCEYVTCVQQAPQGGLLVRSSEIRMNFSGDYKNVKPETDDPWYVAYFEPGYYAVFKKHWNYSYKENKWLMQYEAQPNVPSDAKVKKFNKAPYKVDYLFGVDEIGKNKLKYCPFQKYAASVHKESYNLSAFLQFYCEYPVLCEKLVKEGYRSLLEERLEYGKTGAINLKATTVPAALGLNKDERRILDSAGCNPSIHYLKSIQLVKKYGLSVTKRNCDFIAGIYSNTDLKKCMQYITLPQLIKVTRGSGHLVRDYLDYIKECESLGFDLQQKAILLPSDLEKEHSRTSALIRQKRDQEREQKLAAKTKHFKEELLSKYIKQFGFENGSFLIRPAESASELQQEGAALHHCVGGYAEGYLTGSTIILLIRKKKAPKQPFYTMEVSKTGTIIQCRTSHNRSYTEDKDVAAFIECWKNRKKKKQSVA